MELAIAQRLASSRFLRSIMTPVSNWFMNASGYTKYGTFFRSRHRLFLVDP